MPTNFGKLALFIFVLLLPIVFADHSIPRYKLNLDLPPDQRWTEVMQDYAKYLPEIRKMETQIGIKDSWKPFLNLVGRGLLKLLDSETAGEIRSISKATGADPGEVTIINLLYDITAFNRRILACTSIVAHDTQGRVWHGRNLDYDFGDLLRNMTIYVDFVRNGTVAYSGVTFAYYVNLMTGQRPNAFGITIDERYSGGWYDNLIMAIVTKMKNPVGITLRRALEDCTTYPEAVAYLSTVKIVAPVYYIVSGTGPNQGAVITRDRWKAADKWTLLDGNKRWYVLETNYDHWKKPSDGRRAIAEAQLNATEMSGINASTMFSVLSAHKVLNSGTIYTIVMSANQPDLLKTSSVVRTPSV